MKRLTTVLLFILIALALAGPPVVSARTRYPQTDAQKQAQKEWKKYHKQQAAAQKKQLKEQKKQLKQWKKQHPTTISVT